MSDAREPIEVPQVLDGERVDRAVALLTGWSRNDVQTLLEAGSIVVDGRAVSKSHKLRVGETVDVLAEPAPSEPPQPEPDVTIEVRYEDADVVVVAKPAGLVVHPGAGHASGTLVHGLLARYPEIATVGDPFRPGIVHRLDRDTSGLMVVARSDRAYDTLVEQLSARAVERRYLALGVGISRNAARDDRRADRPIRGAAHAHGRARRRARRRAPGTRCRPSTRRRTAACSCAPWKPGGRTRSECTSSAIGHPIVGDATYGGQRDSIALSRPFLHAAQLAFVHPETDESMQFEEPLPAELTVVLDALSEVSVDL